MHKKKIKSIKTKIPDWVILLQFFIGIAFCTLFQRYYWKTLIEFWTSFCLVLGIGIFFALVTLKFYKSTLHKDFNLKNHFVVSIIFYGFTIPAIFLSLNFHLTQNNTHVVKTTVTDSYHLRYGGLFIETTINNFEKTLRFSKDQLNGNNKPKTLSLTIDEGYFGLTVIKSKSVIE